MSQQRLLSDDDDVDDNDNENDIDVDDDDDNYDVCHSTCDNGGSHIYGIQWQHQQSNIPDLFYIKHKSKKILFLFTFLFPHLLL